LVARADRAKRERALRTLRALVASGGIVLASFGALAALAAACSHPKGDPAGDAGEHDPGDALASEGGAGSGDGGTGSADSADASASRGSPAQVGAMAQTSVLDAPWWPETGKGSRRLGYLRHGAIVAAYDHATPNDDCKEGWYELVAGGFVCGKAVTLEITSPKVRLAPKQPDRDAGLPYRYGVNLTDGTPLYRKVLGTEERKKYEPWLNPPKEEEEKADKADKSDKEEKTDVSAAEEESERPTGSKKKDKDGPVDAGVDAAKPKLKELKGRGVLVRKMARGFYLALDKEFRAGGARWWRTSFGFAVPHERIMLQQSVTKHVGSWFDASAILGTAVDGGASPVFLSDAASSSVAAAAADSDAAADADSDAAAAADAAADSAATAPAFVVGFVDVGFARKIELTDDGKGGKKVGWGAELPKRSSVLLDGTTATVAGQTYHRTTAGFWVRMMDLKLARPQPPADLHADEKWVDVDLTRQTLVAFEGTRPVFATLISSGRRNPQDKEKDFPTPTGTFHIKEKHVTTTMDGDVASDGPYSIEDVPWVMYFQGSYALHGAFWHDAFGRMRSHGCVNMAPEDARTLFAWADPQVPPGWHGAFAKDDASGTRIVVHEDVPEKRKR